MGDNTIGYTLIFLYPFISFQTSLLYKSSNMVCEVNRKNIIGSKLVKTSILILIIL